MALQSPFGMIIGTRGPLCKMFNEKLLKSFAMSKNTTVAQWWGKKDDKWSIERRFTKEVQEFKKSTPVELRPK